MDVYAREGLLLQPTLSIFHICYGLDLKCPLKIYMLKNWSPVCGTIGGDGTFKKWA
jgi:hypothetical protein